MDTHRRFDGAVSFMGRRLEMELDDEQAELDRKKQAKTNDRYNEVLDRANFFFKEEERHGRRVS